MPWASWGEWARVGRSLNSALDDAAEGLELLDGQDAVLCQQARGVDWVRPSCSPMPGLPLCLWSSQRQAHEALASQRVWAYSCLHARQVAAWRSRGRLPLAADITAALVEARLRDEQLQRCYSAERPLQEAASDHALRMAYSLPLIR